MPRVPKSRAVSTTALAEIISLPMKRLRDGPATTNLTDAQQAALALIVDGNDCAVVASAIGFDEAIVLQWLSYDETFRTALFKAQERRRVLVQVGIERSAERAVARLYSILADDRVKADVQLKAVSIALERLRDVSVDLPKMKSAEDDDPVAIVLRRMGVAIPPGASAALGVQKRLDGVVTPMMTTMKDAGK